MVTFIEPLYKSIDQITFGWRPEPGNVAVTYNMYVGLTPLALTRVYTNIPSGVATDLQTIGKVPWFAKSSDVSSALGYSGLNFGNTDIFFAITYVDASNNESDIAGSTIVEVPPVGITTRYMKDDPTINRHGYVFSNEMQKWVKTLGTSIGATVIDTSDFYKANMTTVYTYDGTNRTTELIYPSDATVSGSPAKLITYTYNGGGMVTKTVVSDSTVT